MNLCSLNHPEILIQISELSRPSIDVCECLALPLGRPLRHCDLLVNTMSPSLKPLLLPQLVQERRKHDKMQQNTATVATGFTTDSPISFLTANSSSSDVTSPLTPTFSTRGHLRHSSSTSSLDSPPQLQDTPSSPIQAPSIKLNKRQLADVQEEPVDTDAFVETTDQFGDRFGLYSCLCTLLSASDLLTCANDCR